MVTESLVLLLMAQQHEVHAVSSQKSIFGVVLGHQQRELMQYAFLQRIGRELDLDIEVDPASTEEKAL